MRSALATDSDVEHQEIGGPDPNGLVPHENAQFAPEDPPGELGQVERRGVAASPAPEPGRNGNHGQTVSRECFPTMTGKPRLGVGDRNGG
jgi:hypothetical protein